VYPLEILRDFQLTVRKIFFRKLPQLPPSGETLAATLNQSERSIFYLFGLCFGFR
jgi:hypothetical protein